MVYFVTIYRLFRGKVRPTAGGLTATAGSLVKPLSW
jgi:hypothetical protein